MSIKRHKNIQNIQKYTESKYPQANNKQQIEEYKNETGDWEQETKINQQINKNSDIWADILHREYVTKKCNGGRIFNV